MQFWQKLLGCGLPTFQPSTRLEYPGFTCRFGMVFGRPQTRPRKSSPSLIARPSKPLSDPSVRQRFADIGQEIFPREQQTPEALAALQKAEIEKWWPVIKGANIKGE